MDDICARDEEAVEEGEGERVGFESQAREWRGGWERTEEVVVEGWEGECVEGTHGAQGEGKGELEGCAVCGWVGRECEGRHERCEVRGTREGRDARVGRGGGEL